MRPVTERQRSVLRDIAGRSERGADARAVDQPADAVKRLIVLRLVEEYLDSHCVSRLRPTPTALNELKTASQEFHVQHAEVSPL
jgi:hypothetical protein